MSHQESAVRLPRGLLFTVFVLGACFATGVAIAFSPAIGAGLALAAFGAALALALPGAASRVFLGGLVFILAGYAFFGRGFAYLGAAPVFIGELVLALGLLALLLDSRRLVTFRVPVAWVLVLFGLWGVATTVPHIPLYGIVSLRDAVVWGYAAFALAVVPALVRDRRIERMPDVYARIVPLFIVWAPIAMVVDHVLAESLPYVPGTEVPIIDTKAGDLNVHLGGAAAFLLLGLRERVDPLRRRHGVGMSRVLLWAVWLAGFGFAAATNRGGMLAALAAIIVVLVLRPAVAGRRVVLMGTVGFVLISSLLLSNLEIALNEGRPVSVEQITENFASIFASGAERDGTAEWRLLWWGQIIDYTVFGPFRWTGKGYGINLATDDGFQVYSDDSLRSPHNGHMTILARSGVPGLGLWIALHFGFAMMMLRTYARSRAMADERLARISVWILAYWAAILVNTTFDVFIEGPLGGIWLWSLIGAGIATTLVAREKQAEQVLAASDDDPFVPDDDYGLDPSRRGAAYLPRGA